MTGVPDLDSVGVQGWGRREVTTTAASAPSSVGVTRVVVRPGRDGYGDGGGGDEAGVRLRSGT